jgi:hypothetical protein
MTQRSKNRLTIRRAMGLIGALAVILALVATNRDDADAVAFLLLASLVIVVPLHLAIEGNRRDAMIVGSRSAGRDRAIGSTDSSHEAIQQAR